MGKIKKYAIIFLIGLLSPCLLGTLLIFWAFSLDPGNVMIDATTRFQNTVIVYNGDVVGPLEFREYEATGYKGWQGISSRPGFLSIKYRNGEGKIVFEKEKEIVSDLNGIDLDDQFPTDVNDVIARIEIDTVQ